MIISLWRLSFCRINAEVPIRSENMERLLTLRTTEQRIEAKSYFAMLFDGARFPGLKAAVFISPE